MDLGKLFTASCEVFCLLRSQKSIVLTFALGPDPANPKSFFAGMGRIYRGLGVSAVRSITTHGLLWTFFDYVSNYIDRLPE